MAHEEYQKGLDLIEKMCAKNGWGQEDKQRLIDRLNRHDKAMDDMRRNNPDTEYRAKPVTEQLIWQWYQEPQDDVDLFS